MEDADMKKKIILCMAIILTLSLAACTGNDEDRADDPVTPVPEQNYDVSEPVMEDTPEKSYDNSGIPVPEQNYDMSGSDIKNKPEKSHDN